MILKRKASIIIAFLIFSDIIATVIAFLFAYYLRNFGPFRVFLYEVQPLSVYFKALPFAILLLIAIFYARGLYKPKQRLTTLGELFLVFQSLTLWVLFIMSGSYLVKYDYSRIIVILFWTLGIIFLSAGRWLIGKIEGYLARKGIFTTNILIVGAGRPGRTIADQLSRYAKQGFRIVGFIDGNGIDRNGLNTVGGLNDLYEIIKKFNVDYVYFANPQISYEQILNLVHECPITAVEFKIASNIFPLINEINDLRDIETIPSLSIQKATPSLPYLALKRTMDIILSFPLLLITLPLWIIIALLIKIDSSGKILLTQTRIGKNGMPFTIYKFRTMQEDAPLYQTAPLEKLDSRITKIGKILRKTSLDELPQLINVLKGDMSIVGPRPEMPFIVENYSSWQKRRLSVKPGITGLWQILGRKDIPLSDNLEYDFYYINNQSILLDIIILIKTIPNVLFGKGAF